ncbi:hypothetical protein SanaruYs_22990 [Chryseotalea sanaruensis]|uniref:Secretion system C-terminal sorting domain-containing protein n=1 Tax=Chryseotalea sanaruensis TaxID=2482724 RepID=A0A401UB04_9BACT|nr:BspA family leucine-rich repeat surface protein [Chryseotalea sanaruensis]GCC52067.1 hypothetical protein SanaruYs_22990 [Chryseotalea sanaruensis]
MKKAILFSAFLLLTAVQASAQAFITTWKTDNPGTSTTTQITIPTSGGGYNYAIYWEEVGNATHNGTVNNVTGSHTIEFGTAGVYRIEITGAFPRIYFNYTGDKSKLLTVEQWGSIAWTSMDRAFMGCNNLTIPAEDTPDLTNVTIMRQMFAYATSFNQPIDSWDVSNVVSMGALFYEATSFNQPLGNWDVSNVVTMSEMFYKATSFNQPIDSWDVSNVSSMYGFFFRATSFNQPLDSWNVSGVTSMNSMFWDATSFNQPLNSWDVSNVTSMIYMFRQATSFNQPLDNWNVSNVTNMDLMFQVASAFNQPLESWDVGNVTSMNQMFSFATSFNQPLANWNVSNVTNMEFMFSSTTVFNQSIDSWDVSNVTNMNSMFYKAVAFNQPLSSWNVGNVTNMRNMFYEATTFDQPIGNWNVSAVTDMYYMFFGATAFNQPIDSWDVSSVTIMKGMFYGTIAFNQPINSWNVGNVTDMSFMFSGAASFNQPIDTWDVSNVANMSTMFSNASSFNQPLGNWNVSNVITMHRMFYYATSFNYPLDSWDVSNVTNMSLMFGDATSFNQPLGSWNVSNVTSMVSMFFRASSFNQSLNSWNISNVSDMSLMFPGSKLSRGNYDAILQAWALQNVKPGVTFGVIGLRYCVGEAARSVLVSTHGWIITGDIKNCEQTITFQVIPNKSVGDADFELVVSSSSGLPVTLTNANDDVATLSGKMVTIVEKGITTITASQNGDEYFSAATSVQRALIVKYNQTVTFDVLLDKTYVDPAFDLTATASSDLSVSYSSSDENVATISGSTVTIVGAGTSTITALQSGNDDYYAAPSVDQVLTIKKANQTITFDTPSVKSTLDVPFDLTATSSSNLPVTYSSSDENVATISGSTVTIVGAGLTTITTSQAGNVNYNSAINVQRVLQVKLGQTIAFNALPPKSTLDLPFDLTATSSSNLLVSYSSSDENVATISGNTITIVGAGSTTITALQSGNDDYYAATSVNQVLTVNKIDQTITFSALAAKSVLDSPFDLTAIASSGLTVSYSSSDENVATISGSAVTIVGVGTTTIVANQSGDDDYNPASSVNQELTVNKVNQTITFDALPAKTFGDFSFDLTATSSSGLFVSYSSSNENVATVWGDRVTIVGAGTTTITASQNGDATYTAATSVMQDLVVNKNTQIITFNSLPVKVMGDAPFTVSATSSAGLPVIFSAVTDNITVNENTITITAPGQATLQAIQTGDANYTAAVSVDQTFCINPAKPTISVSELLTTVLTSSAAIGNVWYLGGASVATTPTLTATQSGVYTLVTVIEECTSENSDPLPLIITEAEQPLSSTVSVYPNPVQDILNIDVMAFSNITEVMLYDVTGRLVATTTGSKYIQVNTEALARGIYLVYIKNEKQVITQRINKQ